MADCKHPVRNIVGQCDDCYLYLEPEPISPSVAPCTQCTRHEADAERLAQMNRELKLELILRNQDITDLQLTNRNLSRKIVEDRKKREFVGGVHGS